MRRRIASGQIAAEQVQRPQGHVWRVYLDVAPPSQQPPNHPPIQEAPGSLPHPPTVAAQADAISGLVAATVGSLLGPLVAELAASRQTVERQSDRIAEQAATIGTLTERLAAAERYQTQQEARTAPLSVEPTADTRIAVWQRWGPAILSAVVVLAAIVVLWLR